MCTIIQLGTAIVPSKTCCKRPWANWLSMQGPFKLAHFSLEFLALGSQSEQLPYPSENMMLEVDVEVKKGNVVVP